MARATVKKLCCQLLFPKGFENALEWAFRERCACNRRSAYRLDARAIPHENIVTCDATRSAQRLDWPTGSHNDRVPNHLHLEYRPAVWIYDTLAQHHQMRRKDRGTNLERKPSQSLSTADEVGGIHAFAGTMVYGFLSCLPTHHRAITLQYNPNIRHTSPSSFLEHGAWHPIPNNPVEPTCYQTGTVVGSLHQEE